MDGEKMRMKPVIFTFILLFASLDIHSENADSSYAEYCVNFEDNDTMFSVNLLLVKEYRNVELILSDTQELFKCENLSWSERYEFCSIDKKIGELLHEFTSSGISIRGTSGYIISGGGILDRVITIGPEYEWRILTVKGYQKEKWRKGLLSLRENMYTDVKTHLTYSCSPYFDTTIQIDYRVKLIGECK
jgi:hypothetical protein